MYNSPTFHTSIVEVSIDLSATFGIDITSSSVTPDPMGHLLNEPGAQGHI